MGLLDFDIGKIANNDAFMLGMGLLGNNQGHYGKGGPVYAAALRDYNRQKSLMAQQARANQQAEYQKQQAEMQKAQLAMQQQQQAQKIAQFQQQQQQQKNLAAKYPELSGLPQFAQQAAIAGQNKPPSALDQKLSLYRSDPKAYKDMFPGQKTEINMNNGRARIVAENEKQALGLDPNVPFVWNSKGVPEPIKQTNYSDAQAQAAGFAERMEEAETRLQEAMNSGYDPATMKQFIGSDGGMMGNYLLNDTGQVYTQAQKDWVRAKLRKESGAVIGKEEMADEITTYFPQPGDSADVIAAKEKARSVALSGMARMSGGGYKAEPKDKKEVQKRSEEDIYKIYGIE